MSRRESFGLNSRRTVGVGVLVGKTTVDGPDSTDRRREHCTTTEVEFLMSKESLW